MKSYKQNQIQAIQFKGTESSILEIRKFCPQSKSEYQGTVYMLVKCENGLKNLNVGDWVIKTGEGKYFVCNGKNIKMNELINYVK